MDLHAELRARADADFEAMRVEPSDARRAFLGGRVTIYGLFVHKTELSAQELDAEVEALTSKAVRDARERARLGVAEYYRGKIAALNAIRKMVRRSRETDSSR